jgi:hypothetical protein
MYGMFLLIGTNHGFMKKPDAIMAARSSVRVTNPMKIPPPRFPYGTIPDATGAAMTGHPLISADPQSAGAGLMEISGAAAGAEALFRAFLAEHDHDRLAARFWLEVYRTILAEQRGEGSAGP